MARLCHAEAQDQPIPAFVVLVDLVHWPGCYRGGDRSPEGLRSHIPAGDGELPLTRPRADRLQGRFTTDTAAPMMPGDEELAHVEVDRQTGVAFAVQQDEARDRALRTDQEGAALRLPPVRRQRGIGRETSVFLQLDPPFRPEVGEI